MNIHEYQAKALLARYDVPVPRGAVASTVEEALASAQNIGTPVVVKAQIHAGGRGKAGGVKLARTAEEAREAARELIGRQLVTHQTGPEGRQVRRVLLEEAFEIANEFYLAIALDGAAAAPMLIASASGGMDIEEVARLQPEKIVTIPIDPGLGVLPFQVRAVGRALGLPLKQANALSPLIRGLYRAFVDCDCMLIEINPLARREDSAFVALDAKLNFDDNALFRREEVRSLRDVHEEDPKELEASEVGISYVALDGNIGCMVNGAGLAMGTMDIIKQYGGEPANFLDVGGGASQEMVGRAFRLLLADEQVRGVLVNIFGGIMRCDVIAQGVIDAAREIGVGVPLVVRLQGTNVELGRKLLSESQLSIIPADTMADAAEKIVQAVKAN